MTSSFQPYSNPLHNAGSQHHYLQQPHQQQQQQQQRFVASSLINPSNPLLSSPLAPIQTMSLQEYKAMTPILGPTPRTPPLTPVTPGLQHTPSKLQHSSLSPPYQHQIQHQHQYQYQHQPQQYSHQPVQQLRQSLNQQHQQAQHLHQPSQPAQKQQQPPQSPKQQQQVQQQQQQQQQQSPRSSLQLQDRCDALEAELSLLRLRLQRSERMSLKKENRLSQIQQQSQVSVQQLSTFQYQHQQTLQELRQQQHAFKTLQKTYEEHQQAMEDKNSALSQLQASLVKSQAQVHELVHDRDQTAIEMNDCHNDNAKFLKRLRDSSERVDRLQQENRQLMEQLRELRAKTVEMADEKLVAREVLDRERFRAGQAMLEMERVVRNSTSEVERLQEVILMMGHRHLLLQTQLQQLQKESDSSASTPSAEVPTLTIGQRSVSAEIVPTLSAMDEKPVSETDIKSILASVISSTVRPSPKRRFTLNTRPTQDIGNDVVVSAESKKMRLMVDQIAVLQRGYDQMRQEKTALESSLDLLQRHFQQYQSQHQRQSLHRQKKRESQRQSLMMMAQIPFTSGFSIGESPQGELKEEDVIKAQKLQARLTLEALARLELEEEANRVAAEALAKKEREEAEARAAAEEEARKVKAAKDLHLKETLASLESKRGRSDSRTIQIQDFAELAHLEHLKRMHDEQLLIQQQHLSQQQQPGEGAEDSDQTNRQRPLAPQRQDSNRSMTSVHSNHSHTLSSGSNNYRASRRGVSPLVSPLTPLSATFSGSSPAAGSVSTMPPLVSSSSSPSLSSVSSSASPRMANGQPLAPFALARSYSEATLSSASSSGTSSPMPVMRQQRPVVVPRLNSKYISGPLQTQFKTLSSHPPYPSQHLFATTGHVEIDWGIHQCGCCIGQLVEI